MSIQLHYFRFCVSEFEFEDAPGIGPVIVCDACGDLIRVAGKGVYLYSRDSVEIGEFREPLFAHKGDCHNRLGGTSSSDPHHRPWNELTSFLKQLRHNTGFGDRDVASPSIPGVTKKEHQNE